MENIKHKHKEVVIKKIDGELVMNKVIITPGSIERVTNVLIHMYEKYKYLINENEELIKQRLEAMEKES